MIFVATTQIYFCSAKAATKAIYKQASMTVFNATLFTKIGDGSEIWFTDQFPTPNIHGETLKQCMGT